MVFSSKDSEGEDPIPPVVSLGKMAMHTCHIIGNSNVVSCCDLYGYMYGHLHSMTYQLLTVDMAVAGRLRIMGLF